MLRRAADDLAAVVTLDGATAGVAHARYRNSSHPDMPRADAEDLAAMRGCVAEPDDIAHDLAFLRTVIQSDAVSCSGCASAFAPSTDATVGGL